MAGLGSVVLLVLVMGVAPLALGSAAGRSSPLPRAGPVLSSSSSASPSWSNLSATSGGGPVPRCCAAMAYDVADGYTVLFGGSGLCHDCNDTWVERNGVWENLTPSLPLSPSGRAWGTLAYDPLVGAVVLFGGLLSYPLSPSEAVGDTWEFHQGRWTELSPLESPPPRWAAGMDFDPLLGGLVLFGGFSTAAGFLADTWLYAQGTWSPIATGSSVPARWAPGLAFDASDSEMVLFGGYSPTLGFLNDTWTLQSSQWQNISGSHAPPAREKPAMAFDPSLGAVVLFGGDSCTGPCTAPSYRYWGDTWTFRGGTWSNVSGSTGASPSPRCCASLAFDPTSASLTLTAGSNGTGPILPETWGLSSGLPGPIQAQVARAFPDPVSVGEPTTLVVGVAGNVGNVTYTLAQLPFPCAPSNLSTVSCAPAYPGQYGISVEVRDASGNTTTSTVLLDVVATPGNGTQAPPAATKVAIGSPAAGYATGGALLLVGIVLGVRRLRSARPPA